MKVKHVELKDELLIITCDMMKETLERYNLKYEDLGPEDIETFTAISKREITLSLETLKIKDDRKAWVSVEHLLPTNIPELSHSTLVGKLNRNKDTDAIRINCLLPVIYYLLNTCIPHVECMQIIKSNLSDIKEYLKLTDIVGNFNVSQKTDFVLESAINSDENIFKDILTELEEVNCPVRYVSYNGQQLTVATTTNCYTCVANQYTIKGYAKSTAKRIIGLLYPQCEEGSENNADHLDAITHKVFTYAMLSYLAYICLLVGGGKDLLPVNREKYGDITYLAFVKHFEDFSKSIK